jgi:GNAT superfamily N-acetyltransferase
MRLPCTIFEAVSDDDTETVRALFRAYAASLRFDLGFQNFAAELAGLPAPYVSPGGRLLLARDADGEVIGVVGMKPFALGIAEIKRLYVVPQARGAGLGRALLECAIEAARVHGYERVRLDSHRASMGPAIALYARLGFAEIPPYGPNPGGAFAFFELRLHG